jgi:cytochrome c oxidase subunit II
MPQAMRGWGRRLLGSAAALSAMLLAGPSVAQDQAAGQQLETVGIAHPWEWWHQDAHSTLMQDVEGFHLFLFYMMVAIAIFVLALLVYVMVRFNARRHPTPSRTTHNTLVEIVWTAVPVLILIGIAVPSFRLLYETERKIDPELTLIAHGYQWYWGYEYPDQQIPEYTSMMIEEAALQPGQHRLLSVDNPIVLPVNTDIQILVRANDVIHAFAVPALALKQDANPSRANETWVRIDKEGIYYGQCSELCGTNHAYMPIELHAVSREAFDDWVVQQTAGLDLEQPPLLLTQTYEEALAKRQLAQAEGIAPAPVQ